jgi:hypothetical protein
MSHNFIKDEEFSYLFPSDGIGYHSMLDITLTGNIISLECVEKFLRACWKSCTRGHKPQRADGEAYPFIDLRKFEAKWIFNIDPESLECLRSLYPSILLIL